MLTEDQTKEISQAIDIEFKDDDLLRQVFIHRSYLNENPGSKLGHNERLEFLGDAVLELIVTEFLYKNYPNPEGELTNWRSALVRGQHLAEVAGQLGLGQWLMLSRGEAKSGGKTRQILLANMFEALLGAIYLDSGLEVTRKFIDEHITVRLPDILSKELHIDAKSKFQELTQARVGITPHYSVTREEGPDHAKEFTVAVYLGNKLVAEAKGSSKQTAEQAAASLAVRNFIEANA
jgi:ribonuclease-3